MRSRYTAVIPTKLFVNVYVPNSCNYPIGKRTRPLTWGPMELDTTGDTFAEGVISVPLASFTSLACLVDALLTTGSIVS